MKPETRSVSGAGPGTVRPMPTKFRRDELVDALAARTGHGVARQMAETFSKWRATRRLPVSRSSPPGFGVFRVRDKAARAGRNPVTGEAAPIAARRIVTFYPSPILRERAEQGRA